MLCQECLQRDICQSACPELELHLNEIDKPQREKPIGLPFNTPKIRWGSGFDLTKRQREIVTLLGKGMTRKEICQMLEITSANLRKIIQRIGLKYAE